MPLDPEIRQFLDRMASAGVKPVQSLDPVAAREQMEALVRARPIPPTPVGEVRDVTVPGAAGAIPVRVYRPEGARGQLPLLVYYHGGGHVIGSLDTHDAVARALCAGADCVVASVDYRMGPEARFPAAVDDAFAALRAVVADAASHGADPGRVAVGGDSAGGNLAIVAALLARDEGGPALCHQLLIYPLADYACEGDSYQRYAKGYGTLEAETMHWFRDHYLNAASEAQDWRASPLRAESLANLPPALVITAEYDVLHDEGVALASRLDADGVAVEHAEFEGMIHGFFALAPMIGGASEAQKVACRALREAFAS
ncbi:MAG: alpha/beta hydrolase [Ectothiorhodospiraceae bacterium]|nr:alpha/beta hydrolase [Chromatiales bacterium]MCP5157285.1 alpha/beta hydrolase [Ectothiorhodospiraceae bacterium]